MLKRLEGHLIAGYADGGDDPTKPLELIPGVREDAARFLESVPDAAARFERVTRLVDGFETPYGMELLSTVHFAATRLGAATPDEATRLVHGWNDRKRQFTPTQIRLAWQVLSEQGWLPDRPSA